MNMNTMRILALITFLMVVGCTPKYDFRVDALKHPSFKPAGDQTYTYTLQSKDPEVDVNNLRFQEFASLIARGLRREGYRQVDSRDEADLILELDTGLSDPLTSTKTSIEPLFHSDFGRSRVIATPIFNKEGKVQRYVYTEMWVPGHRNIAGYYDRDRQVTEYEKYLSLTSFENENGEKGKELWTLSVASRNRSSDLRSYLPYMVAAAMPYVGERTNGEIRVSISEDDPTVSAIK